MIETLTTLRTRLWNSGTPRAAVAGIFTILIPLSAPVFTEPSAAGTIQRTCLPFIANRGQVDSQVCFYVPAPDRTIFVTQSGDIVYALAGARTTILTETLAGTLRGRPRGRGRASMRVSDIRGRDASRWVRSLPTFGAVDLGEVLDGIRVELRSAPGTVEKIFVVHPGASPEDIRIRLSGATSLDASGSGELYVETENGRVTFTAPVAYQVFDEERRLVPVEYRVDGDGYRFQVGEYDRSTTLVIDPLLASTYLGTSEVDGVSQIPTAIDVDGNVYVAGRTQSNEFPVTPGVYDTTFNERASDLFVAKFDPDLATLLAATFLGGAGPEGAWPGSALTLDADGNVYVSAPTKSSDFPVTPTAYDTVYHGGQDLFVAKLTPDLTRLLACTLLGGSGDDQCPKLAVAPSGTVYLAGETRSPDFPHSRGAYDSTYAGGYSDAFVAAFDTDLTSLIGCTFMGGAGGYYEVPEGVRVDSQGNICIGGWTSSQSYPTTPGSYQPGFAYGTYDAFVSRLSSDLTTLMSSTFLGGSSWDFIYGLTLDAEDDVYVSGHTASGDFPYSPAAYDTSYNGAGSAGVGDDAFVTKLEGDLSAVLASTYLGGEGWENGTEIALDGAGHVYVGGSTSSDPFPTTPGALDDTYHGSPNAYAGDLFVSRFDVDLTTLSASTYLGGSEAENLGTMLLDAEGNVLLGAGSNSPDFPMVETGWDTSFNGGAVIQGGRIYGGDVVLAKLDPMLSAPVVSVAEEHRISRPLVLASYPNPFNPSATLRFRLRERSNVNLSIFDVEGRRVLVVLDGEVEGGDHSLVWDGRDTDGVRVRSGVYFVRLESPEGKRMQKVVLAR